ncbi:MAG: thiolase family protein [Dehalococcoidales bacterium]|nr:thiolase family protein [Dehalococcoidales bacterium]
MKARNVVIVDGVRTPFSKGGKGKLEAARMDELGAQVVRALLARNPKVKPTDIHDFGIGLGSGAPEASTPNYVAHLAGLPAEVCNFSSNRACAGSQETAARIAMAIALGEYDCGISFGVERMGRTLMGGGAPRATTRRDSFNPKQLKMNPEQRNMPADHFQYFSVPIPDYVLDSPPGASMVQTAQNVCDMYSFTRTELDAFSMRSQHKLAKAYDAGMYKEEVMPIEVEDPVFDDDGNWLPNEKGPMVTLDRDESVRGNTTMEGLAKLPIVKGVQSWGGKELMVTAGNSCPTNSGTTAILIMSEEMALKLGIEYLARVIGWGNGGVKQQLMGIGPVVSTKQALKFTGLHPDQIDRVEFNEAFACQVVATLKEVGIPESKVNVNGGSIGIGHPIGATGNRLIMAVARELRRSNKRYGLCTQCIGFGQGMTTVFENPNAPK